MLKKPITLFVPALTIAIVSCNTNPGNKPPGIKKDTIIVHDTIESNRNNDLDWQQGFNLTHEPDQDTIWGKPVSYYISDPACAAIVTEFYYGHFRPTDNGATDELLKYAVSPNYKLRPFYRWCLSKTIEVSDGALAEHVGIPARRYAEQYPAEFFEYMDKDSTHTRYNNWTEAIGYSGFYDEDDYQQPAAIRQRMIQTMTVHCTNCTAALLQRIKKLAEDCFK